MDLQRRVKCLCILGMICSTYVLSGQYYILGRGLDDAEQPYAHATAELRGKDYFTQQTSSELGVFRFENLKPGTYELVLITAYGIRRKKIELKGSIDLTLHIPRNIKIDEISVIASKAGDKEPVTHENISAAEIKKRDFAQDMPYILEGTPSLVTTSDAGQGIGYSGLRIRGTDPTRINVTLNGIPVNDAESHNVFWVDLPDLSSSSTNIQVQRGLGWSKPGVGDFGGGIHINTLGFNYEPYGTIKLSGGSFDTRRVTVTGGSGLINGRFTLDGRASYIASSGYIDRAESTLYALYGSAGYHHDQTNVNFVYALGDELTYQAWNGVPEQYINDPLLRTFNTAGAEQPGEPYDNEVDDYRQSHAQFHFDQAITPFTRWNTALHYTNGSGYFEQYKADQTLSDYGIAGFTEPADLVRQLWLDNDYYGFISTFHIGTPGERYFITGGGWNRYEGQHFGKVVWTASTAPNEYPKPYYDNDAVKTDWNIFARSNNKINDRFDLTVDLQGRWIRYAFEGPDEQGNPVDQEVSLKFLNPKIGFRYSLGEHASIYGLTGLINKEPNRNDFTQSTPLSRPDPERMWDSELGYRYQTKYVNFEAVGYVMLYKDQLVPTGRLNDVGAYTRVNVDRSHRIGLETSVSYTPMEKLKIEAQATVSSNKIQSFTEYIDNWFTGFQETVEYENSDLAFSPGLLANAMAEYTIVSNDKHEIALNLGGRYIGKQYADNTSKDASSLDPYFVTDASVHWSWFQKKGNELSVGVLLKNALNENYESNAWIYRFTSEGYDPTPDDPYVGSEGEDVYHQKGYFPQAGRYLLVQVGFKF